MPILTILIGKVYTRDRIVIERYYKKSTIGEKKNMKISTKGRYALRLMLDLAVNDGEELIRIKDIAKRQGISEKYLEQIISYLKKAGYVKSLRGAQGGYRLSMEPKEYSVGMILRLTEGNMAPVRCLEEKEDSCDRLDSCTTVRLWAMLDDAVKSVIDKVTLQDLLDWEMEEQKKKEAEK